MSGASWQFGDMQMFGHDLIVADPPWQFDLYNQETGARKGASHHYETMSLEEIKALRVGDLARADTLLLLWTTGWAIAVGQAQEVAKAWGFVPKTEIIWRKTTRAGKIRMGTGYRVRTLHEPILLCTLGNPAHRPFPSVFDGVAREHSRKPEEFYRMVDTFAPSLKLRADLFARSRRAGWASFGNEIDKFEAA